MIFEKQPVKVYRVTVKKLIENLSKIKDCPLEEFKEEVSDAFDGYDFNDIERLRGFENWPDITKNGTYELNIAIDDPNAYEFTLNIEVSKGLITVTNVL